MNHGLERYVAFLESVSTAVPESLASVVTNDIHFRDPFNDLHGIAAFEAVISEMCRNLQGLKIVVTHAGQLTARSVNSAPLAVIGWDLSGNLSAFKGRPWRVRGYSEIVFAADERVCKHVDYWDAAGQLYEELPLLGALCRWTRRRLALKL